MEKKARRSGEDTGADPRARMVGHGAVFPRHDIIGSAAAGARDAAPKLCSAAVMVRFGSVLAVSVAVSAVAMTVTVEAEAADAEA